MTLDDIKTKVQANKDATDSAVLLLTSLSELIRANANDPAKLQEIADQLDADNQALADAVVANTPAA